MLTSYEKSLKYGNFGDKNPAKRPEVREKIRLSKLGDKIHFMAKLIVMNIRKFFQKDFLERIILYLELKEKKIKNLEQLDLEK